LLGNLVADELLNGKIMAGQTIRFGTIGEEIQLLQSHAL